MRNIRGMCDDCHRTRHCVERSMPFAARVIIALQALSGASESPVLERVCQFLFHRFVCEGIGFHPAALGTAEHVEAV